MIRSSKLKVGDWVEIRSPEEIRRTLDIHGRLDGMPFMPEMFESCGKRFQVYKRAHKACDTVFPTRSRRIAKAVHLNTRCDGKAHGGCQAGCLIYWKEEWLKRVDRDAPKDAAQYVELRSNGSHKQEDEFDLTNLTQRIDPLDQTTAYVCQATQLPYASSQLEWWDIRQYVEDYFSGNVGLGRILRGFGYSIFYHLSQAGIGVGRPLRWLYDKVHLRWRGTQYPRKRGSIAEGATTPAEVLDLQPGELVRVKSHAEILKTLNINSMNRGMFWDAEMVPFCGQTHRVARRVTKIINEKTGKMQEMKTPCIVLEAVVCMAKYSHCRMFCPRSIYPYWREIWLERVESPANVQREK